jgi:hypothetical protein
MREICSRSYDVNGLLLGLQNADGSGVSIAGTGDVTLVGVQTLQNKTLASPAFTGTVTGLGKTAVGLASVDNTTDLGKPISTATQTALNAINDIAAAAAAAVVSKADVYAEVDLGTSTTLALTQASHGNRALKWNGSAPATATLSATTSGTIFAIANNGSAAITFLNGTAASGYTNVLQPGTVGSFQYSGGVYRSDIQGAIGGSSGTVLSVNPLAGTPGTVLTATYAANWSGGYQWKRGGTNISGQTSSTYTVAIADLGLAVTCLAVAPIYIAGPVSVTAEVATNPLLVSAIVPDSDPNTISVLFDKDLDKTQTPYDFMPAFVVSGHTFNLIDWGVGERTITIYLDDSFTPSDSATLTFTQSGSIHLQDLGGQKVASFSDHAITNNVVYHGLLSLAISTVSSASVPVSEEPFLDWHHARSGQIDWGYRKRGANLITIAYGASSAAIAGGSGVEFVWTGTDGAVGFPVANTGPGASSDTWYMLPNGTDGPNGSCVTSFPANRLTMKRARVYWRTYNNTATISAVLSDGSATLAPITVGNAGAYNVDGYIEFYYRSFDPTATLNITLTGPSDSGHGTAWTGATHADY